MSGTPAFTIRVTRHFDYPPERVFDAWLDPQKARKFLFATESGEMVRADIDARVGGAFNMTDRRGGKDAAHTGTYLEIDRPRRLVFTFSVTGFERNMDRVTIEIVPSAGGCDLTLTHDMNPDFKEFADRARGGWTTMLDTLGRVFDEQQQQQQQQ